MESSFYIFLVLLIVGSTFLIVIIKNMQGKFGKPTSKAYQWFMIILGSILAYCGSTGVLLSFYPTADVVTVDGKALPVSLLLNKKEEKSPYRFVVINEGYINNLGERWFFHTLNALKHPVFSPRQNTMYTYQTSDESNRVDASFRDESIENMYIAAYSYINKEIKTKDSLIVSTIFSDNHFHSGEMKEGDMILAIDGNKYENRKGIDQYLREVKPKEVSIDVLRNGKNLKVKVPLVKEWGGIHGLGFWISEHKEYTLPDNVPSVNTELIDGGNSAGLMMTIEMISQMTGQFPGEGHVIAGTGSIDEHGKVGAIGGIYNKLATVQKSGADIFLIPKDNQDEAIQAQKILNAQGVKIVPVSTLEEAMTYLKKL